MRSPEKQDQQEVIWRSGEAGGALSLIQRPENWGAVVRLSLKARKLREAGAEAEDARFWKKATSLPALWSPEPSAE